MSEWNYKDIAYQFNHKVYLLKDKIYKFKENIVWDLIANYGFSWEEARIAYVNGVIDGR